uniref:Uncharacterized protein n=1 Tax=Anguilla anguilla TaxID=7936 RepID=A0A0E9WP40_ANGAN
MQLEFYCSFAHAFSHLQITLQEPRPQIRYIVFSTQKYLDLQYLQSWCLLIIHSRKYSSLYQQYIYL